MALTDVRSLIAQLSDADPTTRESAATALYQLGRGLGDIATRAWRADSELGPLLSKPPTVGIAVTRENFEKIRAAFGQPGLADVPPDQDALEFELHFGPGVSCDILTTKAAGAGGAIARFLERHGEGIQQVEYPTGEIDRATTLLRERFRLNPIYPHTREGAGHTRVNFFLAATPEGKKVLIELVELV